MSQIVIGGLGNTKTLIRRDTHKDDFVEKETPEALSEDEFRGFWIKFLGGTIRVGKEKEVKFKIVFILKERKLSFWSYPLDMLNMFLLLILITSLIDLK